MNDGRGNIALAEARINWNEMYAIDSFFDGPTVFEVKAQRIS
jgi:hypothetical protein